MKGYIRELKDKAYRYNIERFANEECLSAFDWKLSESQKGLLDYLKYEENEKVIISAAAGVGKTLSMAVFSVWATAVLSYSLGKRITVNILGGSQKQSKICYRYIKQFLESSEYLEERLKKKPLKTKTIFDNGSRISALTASSKCFDKETRILTEKGLKYFRNLEKGEKVATLNSEEELEWQEPKEIINEPYSGKMFSIETKSFSHRVTPNHNILAYPNHSDNLKFYKPEELPTGASLKKSADWSGKEKSIFKLPSYVEEFTSRNQYGKFECKRNKRGERDLEMDNWLEFFGYFISEGDTKNDHSTVRIAQSKSKHPSKWDKIKNCLDRLPFDYSIDKQEMHFRICDVQLNDYLEKFGKSYDKYIPKELKNLSKDKLEILLDSLILGDGWEDENGLHYITSSEKLRDDIIEISQKLGIPSSFQEYISKAGNKYWQINFLSSERRWYSRGQSEWINYEGRIYCVSVPNKKILVERNGTLVWSGNSVRGEHPDILIIDEAVEVDDNLINAALPRVSTGAFPKKILCSTPHSYSSYFVDLWNKADDFNFEKFHWSAEDVNWKKDEEIEEAKEFYDDSVYKIEYQGTPSSVSGTVVSPDDMTHSIVSQDYKPDLEAFKTMGIDWGQTHATAIVILQNVDNYLQVVEARSWKHQKFTWLHNQINKIYNDYEVDLVYGDHSHEGENERLKKEGVNIKSIPITGNKKGNIVSELRHNFEIGKVKIPAKFKKLIRQLKRYTRDTKRGDDLVDALMLSIDAQEKVENTVERTEPLWSGG